MIKIAIIEDDMPIASMYKMKLEGINYRVELAHDGRSGLELLESFRPGLALLDLRLPEMRGEEILERLRAEEWGGSIRIIIITNISKDEAPSRLRFLHVDRYVVKAHHTPSQVAQIVDEVLGVKR